LSPIHPRRAYDEDPPIVQSGTFSRRSFVVLALAAACGRAASDSRNATGPRGRKKLHTDLANAGLDARPRKPSLSAPRGLTQLRLTAGPRDGLLYVPGSYAPERAFPLLLLLHGAGGNAHEIIARMMPLAEAARVIILAPDSRGRTWDVLLSGFGADITAIDEALDWTFERCAVDRRHVAIGGFSDGASYALSVGLANGDLFTHILAFSPGFLEPPAIVGRPRIFVSHGTQDEILPIDVTSRAFVPRLEAAGYRVRYRESEGPHTVPADVAREALEWFSGRG
jgi:phospholipase/carboxylesterase